jgi:hypothetical protein
MGWEQRNGRRCYYRKRRVGGRVRSIYCGSGERGEAAEREDVERRAQRVAARRLRKHRINACATPEPTCSPTSLAPIDAPGDTVNSERSPTFDDYLRFARSQTSHTNPQRWAELQWFWRDYDETVLEWKRNARNGHENGPEAATAPDPEIVTSGPFTRRFTERLR